MKVERKEIDSLSLQELREWLLDNGNKRAENFTQMVLLNYAKCRERMLFFRLHGDLEKALAMEELMESLSVGE